MMNITEVSLTLMMKLLPIWGMILRRAWGEDDIHHSLHVAHADSLAPRSGRGQRRGWPPRTDSAM